MKIFGKIAGRIGLGIIQALLVVAIIAIPIRASQNNLYNPTTGTLSGLTQVQNDNNALDSLNTCNSGSSAPANQLSGTPSAGNCWGDTSVSGWIKHKIYDGANWVVTYFLDTTNHYYVPIVGGGSISSVASATTTDLCSVNPFAVSITGTVTITGFGSSCQPGQKKLFVFSGILTLTHNATSLILPNNGSNITTAAGDIGEAVYLGGGNWRVTGYVLANGKPLNASTALTNGSTTISGGSANHVVTDTGGTMGELPNSITLNGVSTPLGGSYGQSWVMNQPSGNTTVSCAGGCAGGKMYGFAVAFTPATTGTVKISFRFEWSVNSTGSNLCQFSLKYGTGTAPSFGAAGTGTQLGVTGGGAEPAINNALSSSLEGIATGLTVGTPYWVDLQVITSSSCTQFNGVIDVTEK